MANSPDDDFIQASRLVSASALTIAGCVDSLDRVKADILEEFPTVKLVMQLKDGLLGNPEIKADFEKFRAELEAVKEA